MEGLGRGNILVTKRGTALDDRRGWFMGGISRIFVKVHLIVL